jgi:hypothetical protein
MIAAEAALPSACAPRRPYGMRNRRSARATNERVTPRRSPPIISSNGWVRLAWWIQTASGWVVAHATVMPRSLQASAAVSASGTVAVGSSSDAPADALATTPAAFSQLR